MRMRGYEQTRAGSSGAIAIRNYVIVLAATLLIVPIAKAEPTSPLIVNVNSRIYGPGSPLNIFLEAGTYSVIPIGTADGGAYNAYNNWGYTTSTNPDGNPITSPTTYTGWLNLYDVHSANFEAVTVDGTSIDMSTHPDVYTAGTWRVYPTALLALNHAMPSVFTTNADGYVGFSISDAQSMLSDNVGGMSLLVEFSHSLRL